MKNKPESILEKFANPGKLQLISTAALHSGLAYQRPVRPAHVRQLIRKWDHNYLTPMYVREEDIFNTIYRQLKIYMDEHFITDAQYRQQIRDYNEQINRLTQNSEAAWANAKEYFEKYMQDEVSKEEFSAAQEAANQAKDVFIRAVECKEAYEMQYKVFRNLLSASRKEISLSEIMDYIENIMVDKGGKIVVKWSID